MKRRDLFSIDPSIVKTGFAYFINGQFRLADVIRPKGETDPLRLHDLTDRLENVISVFQPEEAGQVHVIIEVPAPYSYQRSTRGSKSLNIGSLMKLSKAIGAIEARLQLYAGEIIEIPVSLWKGRQSKKIAQFVAAARHGVTKPDAADATCMAEWFLARGGKL
jgi:hypothetical protein